MEKAKRKRGRAITLRMTDDEYTEFRNKVEMSGLTQQAYFIHSIKGTMIPSADKIIELKKINETISDLDKQVRGMATNVNQMAHVANAAGTLPSEEKLRQLSGEVSGVKKEISDIWQSIRSSIQEK